METELDLDVLVTDFGNQPEDIEEWRFCQPDFTGEVHEDTDTEEVEGEQEPPDANDVRDAYNAYLEQGYEY